MGFVDTKEKRARIQSALIARGFSCGPSGADGALGPSSAAAIIRFRAAHHLSHPADPVVDTDLMRELGLLTIPNEMVQKSVVLILNIALSQMLKGTGINMDVAKISKAIAGAISGAGIGAGAVVPVYINLPADATSLLPGWAVAGIPIANAVIGAIVGFCVVYFAPPNKPA